MLYLHPEFSEVIVKVWQRKDEQRRDDVHLDENKIVHLISGYCGIAPISHLPNDKLPNDKLPNDKFPNDKFLNDKLPDDKLLNDKLPNDKLPNDKLPNDELPTFEKTSDCRLPSCQTIKKFLMLYIKCQHDQMSNSVTDNPFDLT
jgi:hypothetical protein